MESGPNTSARRSEDIALDLLKFVSAHSSIGRTGSSSTPGFGAPSASKSEDAVTQMLDLYARCREAVETPVAAPKK